MGKFDGILICTDLDGTLLRNDKSVSAENREAIDYFQREGGVFTFVTGRMPFYSAEAYRLAHPNAPFGCINGGGVYDFEAQRYIWRQEIDARVVELMRTIDTALPNVGIVASTFENTYFCKENSATVSFRARTHLPELTCDYREIREPMAKVIFATDCETELMQVESILRVHPRADHFNMLRSERTFFEVLPSGIDKGVAITQLAEYLGIPLAHTVALGDYDNDIAMLRAAGLGLAVANSCQAALDAADAVTVSNEEHAVARVIYDLADGKYVL